MRNRKAVRIDREDEKGHTFEWEVTDPLDNPEMAILEEETRKELAKMLGPAITKDIDRISSILSPNEAFIVLARKYLRMSNAELAAYLYKTESNVRKTYSQGMHKLMEAEE
jgi:DNA-directed RNA polymerase specialized sigma24 family protein